MIRNWSPVWQTLLGTLLTWGLTAFGAAFVVIVRGTQRRLLDSSLGFAAGVMLAASYWSLLDPALEMAQQSGTYGELGEYAFAPVALGFILGALFVYGTDIVISVFNISSPYSLLIAVNKNNSENCRLPTREKNDEGFGRLDWPDDNKDYANDLNDVIAHPYGVSRRKLANQDPVENEEWVENNDGLIGGPSGDYNCMEPDYKPYNKAQWKRIFLLIVAVTIHNIPEGLAVGVAFGAIGSSRSATFENARNLAFGIAIQNFPEGLAVSLPLKCAGFSLWRSFWYGQLSGMVEPIFGVLGALTVRAVEPLLPYALSFAAGAMVYVVVNDLIPEAHTSGNGRLATCSAVIGFAVMMILDVGLS